MSLSEPVTVAITSPSDLNIPKTGCTALSNIVKVFQHKVRRGCKMLLNKLTKTGFKR